MIWSFIHISVADQLIEGVMAYNHLKDNLKSFLQPFAESGRAVSAEDIKAHFEKLRGDAEAIREAGVAAASGGDGPGGDGDRREQRGKCDLNSLGTSRTVY